VNAVGVWFYCPATNRYLYLMRQDARHPGTWGLPGGKMEAGESLYDTINRECEEELGSMPKHLNLIPLEKFTSADGNFGYHTFFASVEKEFVPILNHEHVGYAWLESGMLPKPLHPGLWSTVNFDVVQTKISVIQQQLQASKK
jgi:8-oxo-dGTP pyrophosphatase MutT (NUDIX family)